MGETRRVLVYGDSVALAGIAASLSLGPDCEVLSRAVPTLGEELRELNPDALIFVLETVPPAFIYTVSRDLPGLLMIGIDLETNRLFLWTGQEAAGMCSHDLHALIATGTCLQR